MDRPRWTRGELIALAATLVLIAAVLYFDGMLRLYPVADNHAATRSRP